MRRLWSDFDTDWQGFDFPAYSLRHEGFLRELAPVAEQCQIAVVTVDAYLEWCASEGLDPWDRDHVIGYAGEGCETFLDWPPPPGDPCWCGNGPRYADCCGVPMALTPLREQYLNQLLHTFAAERSWRTSRQLILEKPELLGTEAREVRARMRRQHAPDPSALSALDELDGLLDRCEKVGIEQAYDELLDWKASDRREVPKELARAVRAADKSAGRAKQKATEQTWAACVAARQALAETITRLARPPGERSYGWRGLCWAHMSAFQATHRFAHLEAAADALRTALRALDGETALQHEIREEHGALLRLMSRQAGLADTLADTLDHVVRLAQSELDACPEHDRAPYLEALADTLQATFARRRSRSDLDRAIELRRLLCAAREAGPGPTEPTAHAYQLGELGMALRDRVMISPNAHDLNEAIRALEEATDLAGLESQNELALLSNLGSCLRLRYEFYGRTGDLDRAVAAHEKVLAAGSAGGEHLAYALNNLGVAHLTRHGRTSDEADVRRAVELLGRAVERTPPDDPVLSERLHHLASAKVAYALDEGRTTDKPDAEPTSRLSAALEAVREFAATAPADSVYARFLPVWRSLLLAERWRIAGDPVDNDTAIAEGEKALGVLGAQYAQRPRLVDSLAHSMLARHRRLGSDDDLERAAELFEFALAVPRAQWPALPAQLRGLAQVLLASGETGRATETYRLASGHAEQGDLRSRFAAACEWAVWAHGRGAADETAEALAFARTTARLVARVRLAGGAEAARRFRSLAHLAARTRDELARPSPGGSTPVADMDTIRDLLGTAARELPGPRAAQGAAAAERLLRLEKSSLDSAGSGSGRGALRAAWAELDRVLEDLENGGKP
ncbi:SEC-C domain-containing protein [Streptomyces sp. NPDC048251]|uniref:SEC-C domain-containing protein n=1 Tax=Streptomyces sp. NPDC048251 TaxID=3154501 RepID=UPI0034427964